MRTIWKITIPVTERSSWKLPAGAEIVHVAPADPGFVSLWYRVDTTATDEQRVFAAIGTGWPEPIDAISYIGTAVTDIGLVWHIFEVLSDQPIVLDDAALAEGADS